MDARADSPWIAIPVRLADAPAPQIWCRPELYRVSQDRAPLKFDDDHRISELKKPLAIRIDADLLAATRECARRDNRSLTNFIETALRRRVEEMMQAEPAPIAAAKKEHKA